MQLYKVKRKVFCSEPDIINSYVCVSSNMMTALELGKTLFGGFPRELKDVCFEILATVVNGPARIISSSCSACQPLPHELNG